jgi:hypothetical protein
MIEIAISLAIIAFALVAIIGILPQGMEVQRQNREETTINQEAAVLLNAIRNGDQGLDDLTNYVMAIGITKTLYSSPSGSASAPTVALYTPTTVGPGGIVLSNGFVIVGLLTTPKYIQVYNGANYVGFYSNHVVATLRAMSGAASDLAPQTNASVEQMAFSYRVISEVIPYGAGNPMSQNPRVPASSGWDQSFTNCVLFPDPAHTNYFLYTSSLQFDLYDVRLVFRWPVLPNGSLGPSGRQVFRAATAGPVLSFLNPLILPANQTPVLFFVQPKSF